jgi:hypothetical protein
MVNSCRYGIGIFPCLVTYDDGNILSANYTTEEYVLNQLASDLPPVP